MRRPPIIALLTAAVVAPLVAQEHDHHEGERLGRVVFPVSCTFGKPLE